MNEERLVEVRRYASELEAEVAVGLLDDAGIPCMVSRNDAAGMLPSLQASSQGGFRLLVNPENLQRATELIADFEAAPAGSKATETSSSPPNAVPSPPAAKSSSFISVWLMSSICLLLGLLLGMKYSGRQAPFDGEWAHDVNQDGRPDYWETYREGKRVSYTADDNFDGKPDVWAAYENGQVVSTREDVNLDGRPDRFGTYKNSILIKREIDTNYDGKLNVWQKYVNGSLEEALEDTDFDGKADSTTMYERGLPIVSSWRKPDSDRIWKKTLYHQGVLYQEIVDTDADGHFDTRRTFDAYGELIQTEKGNFD